MQAIENLGEPFCDGFKLHPSARSLELWIIVDFFVHETSQKHEDALPCTAHARGGPRARRRAAGGRSAWGPAARQAPDSEPALDRGGPRVRGLERTACHNPWQAALAASAAGCRSKRCAAAAAPAPVRRKKAHPWTPRTMRTHTRTQTEVILYIGRDSYRYRSTIQPVEDDYDPQAAAAAPVPQGGGGQGGGGGGGGQGGARGGGGGQGAGQGGRTNGGGGGQQGGARQQAAAGRRRGGQQTDVRAAARRVGRPLRRPMSRTRLRPRTSSP
ncbi:MAG: hypothetical protein J3K34DRAFT_389907 [Monoraphidium minutum]|nr:MAG: hypothetical protein J3K34DRAFT_389907 [Monoraphidium minutum]